MGLLAHLKNILIETSNHREDIKINGDALRIRELFLNLIENGIKYTEEGGSIQITLAKGFNSPPGSSLGGPEGEKAKYVHITVTDTGIGISKEDQQKIFDRFFRVDKARSREQGGSGLGLSICKWIVEAHQGKLSVESDIGKGSSFIVKLPLEAS